MRRTLIALAVILASGTAAASDKDDALATVKQFIDGFNKGDEKTALAACASPAFIIDEFPPFAWQGATAWATLLGTREALARVARKTTFPLWIYVRTSRQPAPLNIATRSCMGSLCLPPTLTPRRSATWLFSSSRGPATSGHGIAARALPHPLGEFVVRTRQGGEQARVRRRWRS